jgi:hypothetical protein
MGPWNAFRPAHEKTAGSAMPFVVPNIPEMHPLTCITANEYGVPYLSYARKTFSIPRMKNTGLQAADVAEDMWCNCQENKFTAFNA